MLRGLIARLPATWQHELRRWHFMRAARGYFSGEEPDFEALPSMVHEGDTVLDAGANIGTYTVRLSRLVGERGRVIAFEPIADTFAILTSTVLAAGCNNVTLINAAVSNHHGTVKMTVPSWGNGSANYYRASISNAGEHSALVMTLDALGLSNVSLIKIDVEGHEKAVLEGAQTIVEGCRPTIIVEGSERCEAVEWLLTRGYHITTLDGSPNVIARAT